MSDRQETVADIVADMRHGFDQSWHDIDREWAHGLADRIEAAHRREMSKIVSKNGADFGQLGDAAAMRERDEMLDALVRIGNWCAQDLAENTYISDSSGNYLKTLNGLCEVCKPYMQKASKLKRYGGVE